MMQRVIITDHPSALSRLIAWSIYPNIGGLGDTIELDDVRADQLVSDGLADYANNQQKDAGAAERNKDAGAAPYNKMMKDPPVKKRKRGRPKGSKNKKKKK